MRPKTESTSFGNITIDGHQYEHDVLIRLDGTVEKRNKKLSKKLYGTSHKISLAEAEYIYEKGANTLVIGTGQYGEVHLAKDAQRYFDGKGVKVVMAATPKAIKLWNDAQEKAIGLFHVTC